jgi:hypothetical protein
MICMMCLGLQQQCDSFSHAYRILEWHSDTLRELYRWKTDNMPNKILIMSIDL